MREWPQKQTDQKRDNRMHELKTEKNEKEQNDKAVLREKGSKGNIFFWDKQI